MADLDLDAIEQRISGIYAHANVADARMLVAEVRRLRDEVDRDHSLCIAENDALAAERDRERERADRLAQGIRSAIAMLSPDLGITASEVCHVFAALLDSDGDSEGGEDG